MNNETDPVMSVPDPVPLTLGVVESGKSKFKKNDAEKPQYALIPVDSLQETVEVLTDGASKYGAYNWVSGTNWSRYFSAAMRHLWAFWNPLVSDFDEETGKHHLAHAICCLMFLLAYAKRGVGTDDRV